MNVVSRHLTYLWSLPVIIGLRSCFLRFFPLPLEDDTALLATDLALLMAAFLRLSLPLFMTDARAWAAEGGERL
jgi:hypothetical protein